MTIPGFGRLLPLQCDMLRFCGVDLDAVRLTSPPLSQNRRMQIIEAGYHSLRRATGQDFSYDIAAWEAYLESNHASQYCHPYGYSVTRSHVQAAKDDPELARLFSIIETKRKSKRPTS